MIEYRFHLHDQGVVLHDPEGLRVIDHDAAVLLARNIVRALVAADAETGVIRLSNAIELENMATGSRTLVRFRDAIEVES